MSVYWAFAARGANAWWRYILSFGFAMLLSAVLAAAIVITLQLGRIGPPDLGQQLQDPGRPVGFFLFAGLIFLLILIGFVIAIAVVHRKTFADVIGAWSWRAFAAGFLVWAMACVALVALDVAIAPAGFHFSANGDTSVLAISALGGLAIQTFAEEFVFRGYLTQGLLIATGRPFPTAVISGLLFGAVHIPNGAPQAVSAGLTGVILALIAIRTGGIAFTYGQHLANNYFAAVIVVSGDDVFNRSPGLFTQNTPYLMWWDTGVNVVALVGLAVVAYRMAPTPAESGDGEESGARSG